MEGICKRFGATEALRRVSLDVCRGRVLALIGENGAGKSTLVKILSGAHRADAGTMQLAGRPYAPRGPHDALTNGVAMIYQELTLAPHLSVVDNVMLGRERQRWGILRGSTQRRLVTEILDRLGHAELDPDTPVGQLPSGARQVVEIARALIADARLLVFDEPTSSLPQRDVERLFTVIRQLKQSGIGLIYISHFLEEVRQICDDYHILRDGETANRGSLEEVTDHQIIAHIVGQPVEQLFPRVPHQVGEVVFRARQMTSRSLGEPIDLEVRRGEILGLAGLVGAGRTELLRTLFGLDSIERGSLELNETTIRGGPRQRIRRGIGLVAEDRKTEGLALNLSIADNLTLSRLAPYQKAGWLSLRKRQAAAAGWLAKLSVKARHGAQPVGQLSGGNQQKVALGRLLHQQADILLLDEPTRGIDVASKAEIYRIIGQLAAEGKTILFASSYFPELLAVCDRIAVMRRGRIVEVRSTDQWTEESLMATAIGGAVISES